MDKQRRLSAIGQRAAAEVSDGQVVGLGSGSTADAMVIALGKRVVEGLNIIGVPTSTATRALATNWQIPLTTLSEVDHLDICIDGADEIDPALNLVKGRGGALLFEKLVALRAHRLVIISSSEKLVERLGTRLPLPVEVVPFGWNHTAAMVTELGLSTRLRKNPDDAPYVTDSGHYILDCQSPGIANPRQMAARIKAISGVVDHGLFIAMTDLALTIDPEGKITEHGAT